MIEGDFSPSFTVDLMRKDLRLIASMAGEAKVPILLSTLVREVYTGSTALGFGDRDINAIVKFFEQNAGM
jgi:3-hydroxyisobutyrate dehydrogenase-like beta-hydroxyacid dehydrogenase